MRLSDANLEIIRKQPQSTRLYLSIYEPQIVFQAQVNDGSIVRGEREITFDNVSLGSWTAIVPNATLWVGTTAGGNELGKIRVKSVTSSVITVSENSNIAWQNDAYLTVFLYVELWPIYPRIIQNPSDPEQTLWYKDYDIPYTNQNSILGTYVNAGPHRAALLDPASGQAQLYYSSTGSYNLLGDTLNYEWWFQGATVTGSSSADPGYITYDTPGHYITRLTISGSSGGIDTTYRYVSIYDQANPPIQKWELTDLGGSRGEGGYSANFKVFETIPLQEHAVVVLFGDNYYGDSHVNLGGNYPNASSIFWVGHVDKDSIQYDYEHSEVTFSAHSVTQMMKESSGFSISVESVASPSQWYELLDMDGRRGLYHYLRWHTTALQIADFQFVGNDYKIQFFDSNRESMYQALDNFMKSTLIGQVVSDRQGKVWMEVEARAYSDPTGTFTPVMNITNRDWMNSPVIEERLSEEVSFMEYGGVAYSGVVTGTFAPLISAAPGNAPGFHGEIENHQGLALLGQDQLNSMLGNLYANKNSPFPSVEMEMKGNYSNLDIAPQETTGLYIVPQDTVRNKLVGGLYIPDSMRWKYDANGFILLPSTTLQQLVNGEEAETVVVPDPESDDFGLGFNVPGLQIPPLPPLTSSGLSSTGSSCCDSLAGLGGLGLGLNAYSILVSRESPVITTPFADGIYNFFGMEYASNHAMYNAGIGRIEFINTGTLVSWQYDVTATYTIITNTNTNINNHQGNSVSLVVRLYDEDGSEVTPGGYPLGADVFTVFGFGNNSAGTTVIATGSATYTSGSFFPASLFKAPRYVAFSVLVSRGGVYTFDASIYDIRVSFRGTI